MKKNIGPAMEGEKKLPKCLFSNQCFLATKGTQNRGYACDIIMAKVMRERLLNGKKYIYFLALTAHTYKQKSLLSL